MRTPHYIAQALLSLSLIVPLGCAAVPPPDLTPERVVERVRNSVVTIVCQTEPTPDLGMFGLFGIKPPKDFKPEMSPKHSQGSGVVIDSRNAVVLTNHHVVDTCIKFKVILDNGDQYRATLLATDKYIDLATLQIDEMKGKLSASPISKGRAKVGQQVLAYGNPWSVGPTATLGIISGLGRSHRMHLQTDAPINPGNSGGPLFNMSGEVIGINKLNYGMVGQSAGVGMAISTEVLRHAIPELLKYKRVRRAEFGFTADTLGTTPMDIDRRPTIVRKVEGGAAAAMGLKVGDVISQVNGVYIKDAVEVNDILMLIPVGKKLTIHVVRGPIVVKLSTTLKEEYEEPKA